MEIEAILSRMNISSLNEMQSEVVSSLKLKQDIILLSPTGTGKTLAFLLAASYSFDTTKKGPQCLVLAPTRELAQQIESVSKKVFHGKRVVCCYGGHSTREERTALKHAPDIIIGTPGRMAYHLRSENLDTVQLHSLILDEFDKSLEFGFQEDMSFIIEQLPVLQQRILTSATQMEEIPSFTGISNALTIDYLDNSDAAPDLTIKKVICRPKEKLRTLFNLICQIGNKRMLIFCNHRDAVDHISELLMDRELVHDAFHGGMEQADRELTLLKFRNGTSQILITTDLAARGLDIPEIDSIIHYQLPYKEDAFVHRNGRTARMKAAGNVYVILTTDENYAYLPDEIEEEVVTEDHPMPHNSPFMTLHVNAGKKDKINKIDIVGYLLKIPEIEKDDVGIIEVKETMSYVAVRRSKATFAMKQSQITKMKNKKVKITRS
ncbi:DEAD/DEAH box helicase [Sphingobacterium spiritivorum]|uniref:DEAD/DEAH box helicase n=1 Tax=Sphingobacterium spiritivorum TaxID=258 RepID=UPI003DA62E4A